MYIVYKLFFKSSDKIYVGKTYDIKKRIADHLYEVKTHKGRTAKVNWMRKHLELSELEYEILFTTEDEQICYQKELEFIKQFSEQGVLLVNSQRIVEAGGLKGSARVLSDEDRLKRTIRFGKSHVLIDRKGVITEVKCLKNWAEGKGLSYKNLHSCVKGKCHSSQGFRVFYKDDWDLKSDFHKSEIIEEFKAYNKFKTRRMRGYADSMKKEFWILNKNGTIEHGFGITEYCENVGYNAGNIINTSRNRRPMYGKILFYNLNDLKDFQANEYYKFYNVFDDEDIKEIADKINSTEKYSRQRGDMVSKLADKYRCSKRRIMDTYNRKNK